MKKEYDVVVAGYTCVDLIPRFKKQLKKSNITDFFKPGKLIEIGEMDFVLGGIVPNTGLAMKSFGKKVFFNGLIGNDFIGKTAGSQFTRYGVSEGMVVSEEGDTAYSIVIAPPGVDRIFLESPGCNQVFDIKHINFEVVSKATIFHFGYPPLLKQFFSNGGRQLTQLYSKVQQMGGITSLDFSLPDPESESGKVNWMEILKNTLPYVDIFVPSLEELLQTVVPETYAEIQISSENTDIIDQVSIDLVRKVGKQVIGLGVKILLIKMGHRGAYLITGDVSSINEKAKGMLQKEQWNNKEIFCNSYQVDSSKIVHASGAGDTAVAAFLSAILNGGNPDKAIKYSAIAGRESLYCNNVYNDIGNWGELTEKINTEHTELIFFE